MKKINPYMILTLVIFVVGLILLGVYMKSKKEIVSSNIDVKNSTYTINDQSVILVDGHSSIEAAPGSASKITTEYFGNEARGDLNGDGVEDAAFLLTQETGGSGVFYYAVAALGNGQGYRGTNGILLGDRISPDTTEIKNGQVIVNYAERGESEPMTSPAHIGVSKYFKVANGELILVK